MKAMILAAGEGKRLRPLTERTPKPLLCVAGRPLLEHHIFRLKACGFTEIVINASYFADQIADFCGSGERWGVNIRLSIEASPLETAGGIVAALPLMGSDPFVVVNADIYTDYPFASLTRLPVRIGNAHLVLVQNPPYHPEGDFALASPTSFSSQPVLKPGIWPVTRTFSGIGIYDPSFFSNLSPSKLALRPLLDAAITEGRLYGEFYGGGWTDVGTPERLAALNKATED